MGFKDPDFSYIDHTADLGIVVRGGSLKELFEAAAGALTRLMIHGAPPGQGRRSHLTLHGDDPADLMVRFLGEILYLFEGEHRILKGVSVDSVSSSNLSATLETVPFDEGRIEIVNEIKAVTYHGGEVAEKQGHWEARIIFDL